LIYGFFSDIHSNLPALEAVLLSMQQNGVEKHICLGDIVGYGPHPEECVAKIRKVSACTILGNHDNVMIGRELPEYFNSNALKTIEWTKAHISEDSINFLKTLPYMAEENNMLFVHASPKSPADWFYVTGLDDAVDAFDFFTQELCFIGHTHCPIIVVRESNGSYRVVDDSTCKLNKGERALINVGSVGQPRDRDPRASWCLYNSSTKEIELMRVNYDVESIQKVMQAKDFPPFLIHRLAEGR
jgi:diadenosine tetraphosphatase ApaH/serine/threonine PP2A family protein phosphatase